MMKLRFLCIFLGVITSLSAIESQNQYEWLENSENIQTQDWIKQQRASFNDYMAEKTSTNEIRESLKKLTDCDEYSIPKKLMIIISIQVKNLQKSSVGYTSKKD
jgi:prolyl oligopeptidase PreP (S9A serine peptidase family)